MPVEIENLYQSNTSPERIEGVRPPEEKLPKAQSESLLGQVKDLGTEAPGYFVVEGGDAKALGATKLTEKEALRGNVMYKRELWRTIYNTAWKLLVYGGGGVALFRGCLRLVTGM